MALFLSVYYFETPGYSEVLDFQTGTAEFTISFHISNNYISWVFFGRLADSFLSDKNNLQVYAFRGNDAIVERFLWIWGTLAKERLQ